MLEKGKISAFQMGMMGYPLILGTAILAIPTIIGKQAERDLWISPFYASFMGFLTVYLAARLNQKFPDKTIIQYGEEILGKMAGKVLGFFRFFLSSFYSTSRWPGASGICRVYRRSISA